MAWPAIAGAVISGLFSMKGGKDRNIAAAAQAKRQMDFQERMSSTAHQREVKDLRAAGLNPILSGTGGAGSSSPGGAQASVQDVLTPAVSSAMAARRLGQEIKNLKAQELQTLAQTQFVGLQGEAIAPRATLGSILNESLSSTRARGDGTLFGGFKAAVSQALRGGSASARAAARDLDPEAVLRLRNLQLGPSKRIGGK